MSIQNQTITTPTGRVIHINYPTPKVNPIAPGVSVPKVEVIRMDFIILADGSITINKLGDTGRLAVIESETKPGFDIENALAWCRSNGWTVRRWPGGARAWKHGLVPVRTRGAIIKLRDELRMNPRPDLEGQGVNLDLAYDL